MMEAKVVGSLSSDWHLEIDDPELANDPDVQAWLTAVEKTIKQDMLLSPSPVVGPEGPASPADNA